MGNEKFSHAIKGGAQWVRAHYKAGFAAPLRFPRVVHIENTNACPARCIMCAMDTMRRKTGIMAFDLFGRLIRECARYPEVNEVHLHGFGEPLLDRDLPAKVRLAKRVKIPYTYIVTTGFLLNENLARDLILAGLDGIKFSFYGMTPQTYERVHRNLQFGRTVQNIERFFEIRDQLRAANPSVRMQFTPDLAPREEAEMFVAHWRPYLDADRGDDFYVTGLHSWAGGKPEYRATQTPPDQRYCPLPFKDIQILWDGRVVPCCFDYDGELVLGDATRNTLYEIWHSPPYEALRRAWREGRSYEVPLCARCDAPDRADIALRTAGAYGVESRGIVSPARRWLRATLQRITRARRLALVILNNRLYARA